MINARVHSVGSVPNRSNSGPGNVIEEDSADTGSGRGGPTVRRFSNYY